MCSAPAGMPAAFIERLGGPDVIRYGTLPVPAIGGTDVLVRPEAVAVDPVDAFVRSGAYRTSTPFPFVLGRDLVGTVVAAGAGAAGFRPGDRVWCGSLGHAGRQGATSGFAAVAADRLYPLPDAGRDPVAAVAAVHPALTAWLALHRHADLVAGETVLVGGGAGNVGTALIRLAADAGARVLATARPDDFDRCRRHGAADCVDYRDPDRYARIEALAPDGVQVWIDTSGRHDLPATVPLLAHRARVVLLAGLGDAADVPLPVGAVYTRDVRLVGFAISNAGTAELAAAARGVAAQLGTDRLAVRVGPVLRFSQAARAHRMLAGTEPRPAPGRIVLVPDA